MEDTGRSAASNGGGTSRTRRRSKAPERLPLVIGCVEIRKDSSPSDLQATRERGTVEPQGGKGRSDAIRLSTRIFEGCENVARNARTALDGRQQWRHRTRLPRAKRGESQGRLQDATSLRAASGASRRGGVKPPDGAVHRAGLCDGPKVGKPAGKERLRCCRRRDTSRIPREEGQLRLAALPTRVGRGSEGEPRPHRRGRSGNRPPGDSTARFEGQPGDGPTAMEAARSSPAPHDGERPGCPNTDSLQKRPSRFS